MQVSGSPDKKLPVIRPPTKVHWAKGWPFVLEPVSGERKSLSVVKEQSSVFAPVGGLGTLSTPQETEACLLMNTYLNFGVLKPPEFLVTVLCRNSF